MKVFNYTSVDCKLIAIFGVHRLRSNKDNSAVCRPVTNVLFCNFSSILPPDIAIRKSQQVSLGLKSVQFPFFRNFGSLAFFSTGTGFSPSEVANTGEKWTSVTSILMFEEVQVISWVAVGTGSNCPSLAKIIRFLSFSANVSQLASSMIDCWFVLSRRHQRNKKPRFLSCVPAAIYLLPFL